MIHPLITLSPAVISLGTDSPVRADVSMLALPLSTIPSIGILSPGFTTIMLPIGTSSGRTSLTDLSSHSRLAVSGHISISEEIDFLELWMARLWKSSPT